MTSDAGGLTRRPRADERICLWLTAGFGGVALVVLLVFPGFLPPMSPSWSAAEVAGFYRDNLGRIRGGMIALNLFGVMLVPFFALVLTQLLRMAHASRALAYSYLAASCGGVTMFALADLGWLIAAFRPDRDPELIMLFNDFAWFAFVTPVGFLVAQNLLVAVSVHLDRGPRPVFPRWVAPFNLVTAALTVPGAFAVMFTTGPLAWDGVLAYWLRFGTLAVYVAVMWWVLRGVVATA